MLILLLPFQELYKGNVSVSDGHVRYYSNNSKAFWADFVVSMIEMGHIEPLTDNNGEIRLNYQRIN